MLLTKLAARNKLVSKRKEELFAVRRKLRFYKPLMNLLGRIKFF
jgi:hypothetical protein